MIQDRTRHRDALGVQRLEHAVLAINGMGPPQNRAARLFAQDQPYVPAGDKIRRVRARPQSARS